LECGSFQSFSSPPYKERAHTALIASHTGSPSSRADVIEGKGNGLVLLLHGGPGTGKTLTAESVAELTHRPLYRVTCGDIGTNAEDVEGYLETVFYLGKKWNCVVLLDEADIFLEERKPTDLHRNALVSVFLRVLEYYEGILILTSNRIGTFDEAFKSRVHLTLHYPPLKQSGRRQIWNNFINRLQDSGIEARLDELRDKVDRLSLNELNGREIRNAIKTATLLAQFRGDILGYSHLKEVIKVSNEFERYLTDIHGHSSSDWAKAQGTRAD
jgi:SpoVK/Ycf46/Vps4 family AAA+-type ATPase